MYRPYPFILIALLFTGCASTGIDSAAPDRPDSYNKESRALFQQPYIDPLTDYLIEHSSDKDRSGVLKKVRQERDRRCEEVADEYASEPATRQVLENFNDGYAYSCPQQVSAFEKTVKQQKPEPQPEPMPDPKPKPEPEPAETPEPVSEDRQLQNQALSDCYLLTTIRNFSAARKACLAPAENGDVRAQANMARVAHAFEDYPSARAWAERAAPDSADAAFLLGQMYAGGQGVSKNMDQALHWYTKAVQQGHKEAQAAIDRHRDAASDDRI